MANLKRPFILALALLSSASHTHAQDTANLKIVAKFNSAVLFVGTDIQHLDKSLVYATVTVQGPPSSLKENENPTRWILSTWSADCEHEKLTLLRNERFTDDNKLIETTYPNKSYDIDAFSEIHFKYICDGEIDAALSQIEPVDARIALLGAIDYLERMRDR